MNNTPRSNTTSDLRQDAQFACLAPDGETNKCIVRLNAAGQTVTIEVRDAAGDLVATAGRIFVDNGVAELAPSGYREMQVRQTIGCDEEGNTVYAMVLRSKWYTEPVAEPTAGDWD